MNFEASRLETFKNWPASAPVDPGRIAKAGFYYMGQNLEVQCFRCGSRLSEWNYNDKVMTRHRALDPTCPFVLSPALSGNVPISNNEAEGNINMPRLRNERLSSNSIVSEESRSASNSAPVSSRQVLENYMLNESARLGSFHNWPVSFIVTPESLAKAGFYCVNQGDKVRCAYCSVIIGRWETGDNPLEEHRRHSPDCSFIQSQPCTSVPGGSSNSGIIFRCSDHVTESDSTMKSLGVQSHRVAKHPRYSCKDARLATYSTWPSNMNQTPSEMAEAGFYYAGSDDQVRCFHCDGGLRKWDPTDDPWVEHARWFPECGFIMLVKGDQFINEVILQHPPLLPEVLSSTQQSISRSAIANHPPELIQVSEEDLERFMNSPTALAALQIGLDLSRVKMAIRQKIEQTGSPFISADDLIEATLDIQLDEVPYQDNEETWSTPMNSPVRQRPSNLRTRTEIVQVIEQFSSQDSSDSSECESDIPNLFHKGDEATQRQEQPTTKLQETVPSPLTFERTVTLEEENRRLREARLCKICMDCEVCVVFLPCGHLVTCVACAHSLADCPLCRRTIKATVRTFLS